jgi:hypothetical protein
MQSESRPETRKTIMNTTIMSENLESATKTVQCSSLALKTAVKPNEKPLQHSEGVHFDYSVILFFCWGNTQTIESPYQLFTECCIRLVRMRSQDGFT